MTDCPRCDDIDDALADPTTRLFRSPDGRTMIVRSTVTDEQLAAELPADLVELVPRQ